MKESQIVLSRQLPKTGQVIEYRDGDDGDYHAGWWKGRSYVTNKVRFISKTINGDVVVIDRATGLMWPASATAAGCNNGDGCNWVSGIDYANALDFAGFIDWRLPNIIELISLVDFSKVSPCIYTDFFTSNSSEYWASTSWKYDTSKAWHVDFDTGFIWYQAMTATFHIRCVRGGL